MFRVNEMLTIFAPLIFLSVYYSGSDRDAGAAASDVVNNNFSRGVPGERVTAEDTLLLELRPFRVYRVGEIVAGERGCTVRGSAGTWSAKADWEASHLA